LSELGLGTIDAVYEHLNSYAWREAIWNQTLVWLAANPPGVTGYGLDSYQSYVPLFFPRGEGQTGVGPHIERRDADGAAQNLMIYVRNAGEAALRHLDATSSGDQ